MSAPQQMPSSEKIVNPEDSQIHVQYRLTKSEMHRQATRMTWSPLRRWCAILSEDKHFEMFLSATIAFNFLIMVAETDEHAKCVKLEHKKCENDNIARLKLINTILLAFYTAECCVKLFAYRWNFFHNRWNNLDFAIVVIGLTDYVVTSITYPEDPIPNMKMLRMFRVARLVRALRVLSVFKELYLMVHGFASAMMAMFWGFVMMVMLLTVWSMLAVEVIHPENVNHHHEDPWCEEVFSSVIMSNLLFFQTVVAGDSWGYCAIPIIKKHPVFFPIFAGVLFTVQMGFTNLILAVIVEQAARSRESDQARAMQEQREMEEASKKTLEKLCDEIDHDNDKNLTLQELLDGFHGDPKFAAQLRLLGIEGDMLAEMFEIMDRDGSGEVSYTEFIDTIHKTRTQDVRMLVTMMKFELFLELTKMKAELELVLKEVSGKKGEDIESADPEYMRKIAAQVPHDYNTCICGEKFNEGAYFCASCGMKRCAPDCMSNDGFAPSPVAPVGSAANSVESQQPPLVQPVQSVEVGQEASFRIVESAGQVNGARQEDLSVFFDSVKAQAAQLLDVITLKAKEHSTNASEEKSKLDFTASSAPKGSMLPPTFTPDGQWQLLLRTDWYPRFPGRAAGSSGTAVPEAKDGSLDSPLPPRAAMLATSETGQRQPQVSASLQQPPHLPPHLVSAAPPRPRLAPPDAGTNWVSCQPMICRPGSMEVIRSADPSFIGDRRGRQ